MKGLIKAARVIDSGRAGNLLNNDRFGDAFKRLPEFADNTGGNANEGGSGTLDDHVAIAGAVVFTRFVKKWVAINKTGAWGGLIDNDGAGGGIGTDGGTAFDDGAIINRKCFIFSAAGGDECAGDT